MNTKEMRKQIAIIEASQVLEEQPKNVHFGVTFNGDTRSLSFTFMNDKPSSQACEIAADAFVEFWKEGTRLLQVREAFKRYMRKKRAAAVKELKKLTAA